MVSPDRMEPVQEVVREYRVMLTEHEMLSESDRDERCGHLYALHNEHCCSFCLVDNIVDKECKCND